MTGNQITIIIRVKYKKKNKITPLYTLNIEFIFHYITLTGYDIVNVTIRWQVITSPQIWEQVIRKKTNITIVYTKCRSYITFITLTDYDIVNDT